MHDTDRLVDEDGASNALRASMRNELRTLCEKLCRELAQSEYSAIVHSTREARRLGKILPAERLRAIAEHAETLRPRFDALAVPRNPLGIRLGRMVGEIFSSTRQLIFDRLIDAERSYRGTILGAHHGIGTAKLLRDVARLLGNARLVRFCDDFIAGREPLVQEAEKALVWVAQHPAAAIVSSRHAPQVARDAAA